MLNSSSSMESSENYDLADEISESKFSNKPVQTKDEVAELVRDNSSEILRSSMQSFNRTQQGLTKLKRFP